VNAVEHGEGKEVVVTTAMDSDAVAVSVRDYGVGLRPGEEQKVFDRFWRADPARARTLRAEGWITVAALLPAADWRAEARRLDCGHVLQEGTPHPVAGRR